MAAEEGMTVEESPVSAENNDNSSEIISFSIEGNLKYAVLPKCI